MLSSINTGRLSLRTGLSHQDDDLKFVPADLLIYLCFRLLYYAVFRRPTSSEARECCTKVGGVKPPGEIV